jgi:prevent-host-death family protein
MREVGVLEAKTHLSSLLDAIEKDGEAVMITRNGRPVATLSPANDATPKPRRVSAAELVARSQALRDKIAASNSGSETMTWEELKQLARE